MDVEDDDFRDFIRKELGFRKKTIAADNIVEVIAKMKNGMKFKQAIKSRAEEYAKKHSVKNAETYEWTVQSNCTREIRDVSEKISRKVSTQEFKKIANDLIQKTQSFSSESPRYKSKKEKVGREGKKTGDSGEPLRERALSTIEGSDKELSNNEIAEKLNIERRGEKYSELKEILATLVEDGSLQRRRQTRATIVDEGATLQEPGFLYSAASRRAIKEEGGPSLPPRVLQPPEIKAVRTKLSLTQNQLAELAGVTGPYISQIESGSAEPRTSTLEKITEALYGENSVESVRAKQGTPAAKEKKVSDFVDTLRENVKGYSGIHSSSIKRAPEMFELFQTLSKERNLRPDLQNLINSVISYFVLPYDALPESELGPFGYIDDLYLCAFVIDELSKNKEKEELIRENWEGEGDVFKFSSHILEEVERSPADSVNEVLLEEVLDRVGLKGREITSGMAEERIEVEVSEERACSRCGEGLPPSAHSWTKYCDDCAKVVYESSESIVSDIKGILSDMQR